MRTANVLLLVKFFLLFIVRQVLGKGPLREPWTRWAALGAAVMAFIGYCALSYVVLSQVFEDAGAVELLMRTAGISTIFWIAVIYTVIRVLFLRADELLQLTYMLPATNRERTLAFTLFEAAIIALGTLATLGAFSLAGLLLVGPSAAPLIAAGIFMPVVVTYLCFSLLYMLIERALLSFGLARLRGAVVPVLLAGTLLVFYRLTHEQTMDTVAAYAQDRQHWPIQLVFLRLTEDAGFFAATGAFLAVTVALLAGVLVATPHEYVPVKRFFKVLPSSIATSRLGSHILVLGRSFETSVVVTFIFVATGLLFLNDISMPPYVLVLLTFQGVYSFANSESLRRTGPHTSTPMATYLNLIGSQSILVLAVGAPVSAVALLHGVEWASVAAVFGFCLVNTVLATLVGIVFPPHKGNPFSVVVGLALMLMVGFVLALGINFLSLPASLNVAMIAVLTVIAVFYSFVGLIRTERKRRYEMAH